MKNPSAASRHLSHGGNDGDDTEVTPLPSTENRLAEAIAGAAQICSDGRFP
jgi:hypothetical protein